MEKLPKKNLQKALKKATLNIQNKKMRVEEFIEPCRNALDKKGKRKEAQKKIYLENLKRKKPKKEEKTTPPKPLYFS